MPPEGAPGSLREKIAEGRAAALRRLTAAVQPLASGSRTADVDLTARVLSALSDEYARLILTDPVRYPVDRLLSHARWWLGRAPL